MASVDCLFFGGLGVDFVNEGRGRPASYGSAECQTGASDWSAHKKVMCSNSGWGGRKNHLDEVQ